MESSHFKGNCSNHIITRDFYSVNISISTWIILEYFFTFEENFYSRKKCTIVLSKLTYWITIKLNSYQYKLNRVHENIKSNKWILRNELTVHFQFVCTFTHRMFSVQYRKKYDIKSEKKTIKLETMSTFNCNAIKMQLNTL